MTEDGMSELAEALATACDEWIAGGGRIGDRFDAILDEVDCRCPFGALHPEGPEHPGPSEVSAATGISTDDADAFMRGFDDATPLQWFHSLYSLGRQFREQYTSA